MPEKREERMTKRKWIAAVLSIVVLVPVLIFVPVQAQNSVAVNLYASTEPAKSGDTISLNVNFQTFPNLTRFGPIEIQFDPAYVSFLGMDKGTALPSTFEISNSVSTSVIALSGLDQTVESAITANQTAPTADAGGNPLPAPVDPSMHSDDMVTVCVLYFKVIDSAPTGDAHFLLGNIGGFRDSSGSQVIAAAGTGTSVPVVSLLSSDASLSALAVEGVDFTPAFSSTVFEYEAHVPRLITEVNISASAANAGATVTITGKDNLQVGDNLAVIRVVAQDGKTAVEYKINVIRDETFVPAGASIPDQNGKIFTFAELPDSLKLPTGFAQDAQMIGTQTVPVFTCVGIRSMILYLKDGTNDPALYIYNPDTGSIRPYQANSVLTQSAQMFVAVAVPDQVAVPEGFTAGDVKIGNIQMKGFLSADKKTSLVYLSDEAGINRFYMIDAKTGGLYPYMDIQKAGASYLVPFAVVSVVAVAELAMIAYIIYEIRKRNRPKEVRRV